MASIEEIKARWTGVEGWGYDPNSNLVYAGNPTNTIAQLWDKFEMDLPGYEANGPRIAAAPVDIATLLTDREQTHERLRELQKAYYAAVFGMPEEESTRLRKAIQDTLDALG